MKKSDVFKIAYFVGKRNELFVTEFGYSKRNSAKRAGPSTREFYVLHLEVDGDCELEELDIRRGEAFLLSKNSVHSFRALENSARYWICFGGTRAEELLSIFDIPIDTHVHFSVSDPEELSSELSRLFRLACEYENSDAGEAYAISALMSILPRLSVINKSAHSSDFDYVSQALRYMKQNCGRNISMEYVAARLCISEKHLCRLFCEKLSISPKAAFQKIRMQKAERLLCETKIRISEIAEATGFSSQNRFSQAFIKEHGISPTNFRLQKREGKIYCAEE